MDNMKRRICVLLAAIMMLGGMKVYAETPKGEKTSARNDIHVDNPSAWAQNEVSEAIGYGIVTEDFQCNYTEPITREDFCRLIVNTLRVQIEAIPNHTDIETISFTDTDVPDIKLASALGNSKRNHKHALNIYSAERKSFVLWGRKTKRIIQR